MSRRLPRIEQWCTVTPDPYQPAEVTGIRVVGGVFGHPNRDRWPDGKEIQTSRIIAVRGRVITTRSGSRYRLGEPSPDFLTWLASVGRTLDPKQPIRMVS